MLSRIIKVCSKIVSVLFWYLFIFWCTALRWKNLVPAGPGAGSAVNIWFLRFLHNTLSHPLVVPHCFLERFFDVNVYLRLCSSSSSPRGTEDRPLRDRSRLWRPPKPCRNVKPSLSGLCRLICLRHDAKIVLKNDAFNFDLVNNLGVGYRL